jgi:phospholipid/cholesterol/gamma-HCH transport system permease protein
MDSGIVVIDAAVGDYGRQLLVNFFALLGSLVMNVFRRAYQSIDKLGRFLALLGQTMVRVWRSPFRVRVLVTQLDFVGVQSVLLIAITGSFTGMVSALQGYHGLHRYGAESMVGATVALALSRELGPVLSALMVIGRVGSAMTAELGSMRNTDQIDALSSMAIDPIHYLVMPRVLAATFCLPFLAFIFSFCGVVGAHFVSTFYLGIDPGMFMSGVRYYMDIADVSHGLLKAVVFGLIFSLVACYEGFYSTGGSRGVGLATTRSVVTSAVLVLLTDYFMTTLMFRTG